MSSGKLDAVGLVVSDLSRSVAFYRLLGAPFAADAGESEHGHAEAELAGGFRFLLDTEESVRSFDPGWSRAQGSPGGAVAFRCERGEDVDRLYAKALQAGGSGHKEPWDAFWGQRYAQLRDPDGNGVDLYAEVGQGG
jgi:catechol 2,3-dioxygenase-like lactoylglutathione lyase family enzyme